MGNFSHLTSSGQASMVDIAGKQPSCRRATVHSQVAVSRSCRDRLNDDAVREISRTARLAAIQGCKWTSHLVPLCHQVSLTAADVAIAFDYERCAFTIQATTASEGTTGVEMEAFTAATVAGLTIYDMIKAVDPAAIIGPSTLQEKSGGKAGLWQPAAERGLTDG